MNNIFISGHRDLDWNEFMDYYAYKIEEVFEMYDNLTFYIGDCEGCDNMSLNYIVGLLTSKYKFTNKNVNINVCMLKEPFRGQINNLPQLPQIKYIKEFNNHEERDSYMTMHTDCDLLWIRNKNWASGTAQNLVRRYCYNNYIYIE